MKLGWGILHDSDSLWASVLRSKYIRTQEGTDQVHAKGRDSPLWKAICKVFPDVITGTAWSVRNGRNVKFWSDKWLENFGPLIQYVPQVSSVNNINAAVMDMVSPNNQWCWDWEAFAHLLHVQVVMGIASYPPPATDMKEDTRFWGSSASEIYLGMERIKSLLWIVDHNRAMTNEMGMKRHLTDNPCCRPSCQSSIETILHVVRDCPAARNIWRRLVEPQHHSTFFNASLMSWLLHDLANTAVMRDGSQRATILGVTIWMVWKARNQKVFGQVEEQGADTLNAIRHMVADIRRAYSVTDQASVRNKRVNIVGWLHPPLELAKLNVDGCSRGNPGAAGAGGLIWDNMGSWIKGFAININTGCALRSWRSCGLRLLDWNLFGSLGCDGQYLSHIRW
ncbi:hypothetical protein NC651_019242 [Populus alba x Populus x berolinensis]|nr:hypothetical protein NC651_019242 [Populus alba x Populus x berolinensis]